MMEIKDLLKKLKESSEFKDWKKKNNTSFLAHVFKMLDDANQNDWQVGFYNKDDTITTFMVTPDSIKIANTENIFKRPDAKIRELKEDKINIDITEALQTAEKTHVTEFKQETTFKIIIILQRLENAQVYNITYVTQSFKVLNFKIDSTSGRILEKTLKSVMEFRTS